MIGFSSATIAAASVVGLGVCIGIAPVVARLPGRLTAQWHADAVATLGQTLSDNGVQPDSDDRLTTPQAITRALEWLRSATEMRPLAMAG